MTAPRYVHAYVAKYGNMCELGCKCMWMILMFLSDHCSLWMFPMVLWRLFYVYCMVRTIWIITEVCRRQGTGPATCRPGESIPCTVPSHWGGRQHACCCYHLHTWGELLDTKQKCIHCPAIRLTSVIRMLCAVSVKSCKHDHVTTGESREFSRDQTCSPCILERCPLREMQQSR